MESSEPGWWRRHGWTAALLLSAFGIALLVRTLWMAPLIEQFGALNVYGGGSDSFYHSRVMTYIILNHQNLVKDPLLHYPFSAVNPREPLFDWMNAVLGIIFAPLFGGNAVAAGAWFLDAQGPIWAALGVFPIYLIGKEVASKKAGIVAAFLYPLMVANIDSSTFGYANYLSFYTFVILVTVYGYIRTVKASGHRRFVESYRHPRQIPDALRQYYRTERTAVKWAVFTGVSFGALALAWQGYTFALAVIVIFLFFALIVERIRRIDSFSLYVSTWIIGLIGFPMAVPYYVPQGLGENWFGLPLVLFLGAMLIALPFVCLRDQPWVISIPILAGLAALALGALYFINQADFVNIVTGQGYFVKTLVYSTVAEAQAPSIDALIVGYGVGVFFLAFAGLALVVWALIRQRMPRVQMLFIVFAVVSIYLPISAAKFFFLGSAGFALLAAIPLVRAFEEAQFAVFRRTVAQLSDRRSQLTAFRRGFKIRHVLIPVLVGGLIVSPVVWYAIDAGIPYNSKTTFDQQIYNTLPPPLRVSAAEAQSFYLGAAGTELDTPNQYDEAGYSWLAQQDQNLPESQRPAFISWWDYGFQAVAQGLHPTVADNFQNGIDPSGNFLLSQNESLAIGILTATLLSAEAEKTGQQYLPAGLNAVLAADGVNVTALHNLMVNTSNDIQLVLDYPNRYLPVDPNNIDGQNAMYDTVSYFLATTLSDNGVAQVYNDVEAYTGWSIRYAMVDNRLFPYSGSETGIFYAPADLTDRVIGSGGAPTTYFTLTALGSDGNTYPVDGVPAGVSVVNYNIAYSAAFYNSMIYRTFIGYNGTDAGLGAGIPGLPGGSLQSEPIEPGWMLQHFQVVYRTAYYCPYSQPSAHPGCYTATNLPTANALAKAQNGSVDSSGGSYIESGGESILEYYPGQTMTGTVTLPNGRAVPNAFVTVDDAWGIPHEVAVTGPDGAYSVVLPPGNDTVNVSIGTFQGLSQQGTNVLADLAVQVPDAVGLNPSASPLVRPIVLHPSTVQGYVYWNTGNNSSYIASVDTLVPGANVTLWGAGLTRLSTTTDASGTYVLSNVPPGVYNLSVTYRGANYTQGQVNTNASANSITNKTIALQPGQAIGTVLDVSGAPVSGVTVTASDSAGIVSTAISNLSGGFVVSQLAPGNYSLTASEPSQGLGASPAAVTISAAGGTVKTNLTLEPFVTLTFSVIADGNPAAGIAVRLTSIQALAPPTIKPGNATANVTRPTASPSADSTLAFSGTSGFVTAFVPAGNYSVYGLGQVGGTLYAGLTSAYVPAGTTFLTLAPLFLSTANEVSGSFSGGTAASATGGAELIAFDPRGDPAYAFVNTSGDYAIYLPSGTYSFLAVSGLLSSSTTIAAALRNATISSSTSLNFALAPAVDVNLRAGFPSTTGFYPAAQAAVRITLEPLGATITALADSTGNVSFLVPGTVASGSSYCLSATALGYSPYSTCGLSPSGLAATSELPMRLSEVPVTVVVRGLPSGTTVDLNFTAEGAPAQSASISGSASGLSLDLFPGQYTVTGWARSPSGGLLLPPSSGTSDIPFGSLGTSITIQLIRQVSVNGTLSLPGGVSAAGVTVRLTSDDQNLSLTGTAFQSTFFAAPGTYTLYAAAINGNRSFARLETVTVGANGGTLASVVLTGAGTRVTANLTQPDGARLDASFAATITGPGGTVVSAEAVAGQIVVILPANETYGFQLLTTQLVNTSTTAEYQTFQVAAGYSCAVGYPNADCIVPLTAVQVTTSVSGSLLVPGDPTPVAGSVRLVGPAPLSNLTVLSSANGTFSADLLPGTYTLYATGTGAGAFANISTITVPTAGPYHLNVSLAGSWTETVILTEPTGGLSSLATVTFKTADGAVATFTNEPYSTALPFLLPTGVYTVTATASASPYGVATNASASTTVALLDGNAATSLNLTYRIVQTATLTLLGTTHVTLGNGGLATFTFVVNNTGNAPEALHFVGSPATWNFTFLPANATLGTAPSNDSVSVEVLVRVPVGTLVSGPTLQLEAELPDGSAAGFVQPLAKITLTPTFGLIVGASVASGASIGPTEATLGFFIRNTGTASEVIDLGVADAARLIGLGWSAEILSGTAKVGPSITIAAGSNNSYSVQLTAPTGAAVPPGFVTVATTLQNTSAVTELTLTLPSQAVSLNSSGLYVTGPSLGSPPSYPSWLVPLLALIPAAAVVAIILFSRYWSTRRWSRR
jgi:dolichyl-phosphooligosaccharide-protein glycotransferase